MPGALPAAQPAERLCSGLLLTGHLRTRGIDGRRELPAIRPALAMTGTA